MRASLEAEHLAQAWQWRLAAAEWAAVHCRCPRCPPSSTVRIAPPLRLKVTLASASPPAPCPPAPSPLRNLPRRWPSHETTPLGIDQQPGHALRPVQVHGGGLLRPARTMRLPSRSPSACFPALPLAHPALIKHNLPSAQSACLQVYRPYRASSSDMQMFHSKEYIEFLQKCAPT